MVDLALPIARSPIPAAAPVAVEEGWEVSRRRTSAPLRLQDLTPLAKVLVRADPDGAAASLLGVPNGRSATVGDGALLVGSGPGEWLLLSPPGTVAEALSVLPHGEGELVSRVDVTHGRAMLRLSGVDAARCLAKVCAIDFADAVTPNGRAFRSSVAKLATDVVRSDRGGERSYLLHCERSSGRYLHEALLDAGMEFGIDTEGFTKETF